MPKIARLSCLVLTMSTRRAVAFRSDLIFELVLTVITAAAGVGALAVLALGTDALAGWTTGQVLALIGTFALVTGIRTTFIEPNMEWFGEQVRDGRFDAILVRPAPSIFLASLGMCSPLGLIHILFSLGLIGAGTLADASMITAIGVAGWVILVLSAVVITWATRVITASVVFWALGLSLDIVYDAVWQFARYPVQLYRPPLRLLFTFIIPIALLASTPTDVLLRGGSLAVVPIVVAVAAGLLLLAVLLWRLGLRRYVSATS